MATRARMHRITRQEAKGPSYTRARQQLLLSLDDALEDFSFQIDAHTVFASGWDDNFLAQWADTDNKYTVRSTYPLDASDFRWEWPKGWSLISASAGPGLRAQASCATDVQKAALILVRPTLTKFWAPGLNFSRSHAERGTFPETFVRDTSFWVRSSVALLGFGLTATFCTAPLGLSLL